MGHLKLECGDCGRLMAFLWRPGRTRKLLPGEIQRDGCDAYKCKCGSRWEVERAERRAA